MSSSASSAPTMDQPRIYSTAVTALSSGMHQLSRDIPVVVEDDGESVSVAWLESGVTGIGDGLDEALASFELELVELFEELEGAADETLGPVPLRWKRVLLNAISRA